MRCADGCYAENRNADGGDDKTNHGGQDVSSGQLAKVNGENQVACAKEHTEQGSATKIFCRIVSFFAVIKISSFMEMIITETVAKWKSLIIIDI